jgi:hypothetical protein
MKVKGSSPVQALPKFLLFYFRFVLVNLVCSCKDPSGSIRAPG